MSVDAFRRADIDWCAKADETTLASSETLSERHHTKKRRRKPEELMLLRAGEYAAHPKARAWYLCRLSKRWPQLLPRRPQGPPGFGRADFIHCPAPMEARTSSRDARASMGANSRVAPFRHTSQGRDMGRRSPMERPSNNSPPPQTTPVSHGAPGNRSLTKETPRRTDKLFKNVGRSRAKFGRARAKLAEIETILVQSWPSPNQFWPKLLVDFGKSWPHAGPILWVS